MNIPLEELSSRLRIFVLWMVMTTDPHLRDDTSVVNPLAISTVSLG